MDYFSHISLAIRKVMIEFLRKFKYQINYEQLLCVSLLQISAAACILLSVNFFF